MKSASKDRSKNTVPDTLPHSLREAMAMQEIEGNPFDEADKALFEMFERENMSPDERRRIIIMQAKGQSVPAVE
ncbi:MAG: hypothetical protein NTX84_08825 [Nitrospirae bacterium]|nr:hypothetical protein [Nitrospirota bacterium]